MTWQIYDASGYVTDFASGGGLTASMKYLRSQKGKAFKTLANEGHIVITPEVIKEFASLKIPSDKNIAVCIATLKEYIGKCDEIMIIGNGIMADDDETDDEETKAYIRKCGGVMTDDEEK